MSVSRREFLKIGGAAGGAALLGAAGVTWASPTAQDTAQIDEVYHLVNRITWGVRSEMLAHAREIGYEAFLDEQLAPETIDDSAMDAILATMPVQSMNRHDLHALIGGNGRAWQALIVGMVQRAVHSERQLYERVVEFWLDHFNISSEELAPDILLYNREVVRRYALGNFRDLMMRTTSSPAMLVYLDNYINVAEHPNENYARELLELHTLGVDGGYTEKDVREIARAFTGWTTSDAIPDGFIFDSSQHDTAEKYVLGHTLPEGRGIEDGLHVLSILNEHPSTARFLCTKLIRRFVSDVPPESLIDSAAQVWIDNAGEIRPVLRHIFTSSEFRASANQKLRRPLEYFIAAMRATGTEFTEFWGMAALLEDLAQVPYGWVPPDGYPDVAGAWMNTGGLLARWNTAVMLTHEATSDINYNTLRSHLYDQIVWPKTVGEMVDAVADAVFGDHNILSAEVRSVYIAFASDDQGEETAVTNHMMATKYATLFGLMLSSPQFQWR
ncbi:MAG: DUF1800 domain-containing protein [Anaerolineae bacterium]